MYPPHIHISASTSSKRASDPANDLHGHLFRKGLTVLEKVIDPRER